MKIVVLNDGSTWSSLGGSIIISGSEKYIIDEETNEPSGGGAHFDLFDLLGQLTPEQWSKAKVRK